MSVNSKLYHLSKDDFYTCNNQPLLIIKGIIEMASMVALNDLGIKNIDGIEKIKVEHTEIEDILTVYYRRAQLSVLSNKKRIVFKRSLRQVLITKQGKQQWKRISSVSSRFQTALDELHCLSKSF